MIIHSIARKEIFYRYCLHAFITGEILKRLIKDCLKVMVNKELQWLRKVIMLNFEIGKEK